MMPDEQNKVEPEPSSFLAESVTTRILRSFVDSLEGEPGLAEVAARLRQEIIEKGGRSEAVLKRALFGGEDGL
jgi:hypothetical protein